ncbi:MAG TPA: NADH-quinone oxidoreductase subunit M [Steroidobacteraceae bacterium]|jgi:NADH-quinone oxidoreductase subunit M|nr:NADH-quinone oxidoreductase subunit M [Steroidobacteraceae bacterium]
MHGFGLLSVLIWLPILAGVVVLGLGERSIALGRWLALLAALATFVISIFAYTGFDTHTASLQFVEKLSWIPSMNAYYGIGLDGISLPLVLLTTFMTIPVIIAGWTVIEQRPAQYYAAFLIMEGLMVGVFSATDALLFYFFWEAMLIPMFLIIGIWGGPRRVYATIKFFLYTFLGSVLMLAALIYMYVKGHDYAIAALQALPLTLNEQRWIFLAFLLAFAVKVPMWPVHTWLPDAHVEAPTGGSVILAAIMLKMGGYGFLRFSLPVTPDASRELVMLIVAMSLIAVVYIGFVALVQQDMKKLIAYSSIAHMGFVTLGTFGIYAVLASTGSLGGAVLGVDGAIVQMVSHGLVSGALFLCVGVLYDRMHSREIASYGGVVNVMPYFAALMVFFGMANSGLPGTSGFVGEFMVIIASFKASFWYAFLAATTLVLGAAYTLWMIKRVIYGPVTNTHVAQLTDLNGRESLVLGVLAVAVLLLGVYPAPLLNIMEVSVQHLVQQAVHSKLPL